MDIYDITAGAKLAHDHAAEMKDKIEVAKDMVRALCMFDARIDDDADRSAFNRIIANVETALGDLEDSCSEIADATDLDRMRSPHTWTFKQLPFNQRRGTGMHFNDAGDVFLEWQHGDGRRTGTQYAAVMNYERDDRGGIASHTPVKPKKPKEAV